MKHIISSGSSVINRTVWRDNTLIGFHVSIEDKPAEFDTIGDAMKVCIEVNNLIGHPSFRVMAIND